MKRSATPLSLERLIRPAVLRLVPYQSARDTVQQGILLDANENPFEKQREGVLLNRYPDPHQRTLRQALSETVGVPPTQLLGAAGSDEVLDWLFKVFVDPATDQVAIAQPTYGMYRVMADIFGVEVFDFDLDGTFDFDANRFLNEVPADVKLLFLCSPNNPTGNLLSRRQILTLLKEWNRIVVVDEAYLEFAEAESLLNQIPEYPNLIVMKTFSKALGRAGLRLGYVVADSRLIVAFQKVKSPYNLSALTMQEGIRVLQSPRCWQNEVNRILSERERLQNALQNIPGVEQVFPSRANFLLFRCRHASGVQQELLARGIVVRDRSSMKGLHDCIRVTVGTPQENERFLAAMLEITGKKFETIQNL